MTTRFNLAAHVLATADTRPDTDALWVTDGSNGTVVERWRHGDLASAVRAVAGGLREAGLEPGERILLRLGNTAQFPLMFFGSIAAGLVPVPTSTQLTAPEVEFVFADSGARAIATDDSGAVPHEIGSALRFDLPAMQRLLAAKPAAWAETEAEDPAFLVYTSGTSGRPRGVLHAQRVILGRRPMASGWLGLQADDRILHAGAFNWTYTLGVGLMDPWVQGATAIVHIGVREPTVWPGLIEAVGATVFAAVPALYRRILKYGALTPDRLPTLRHAVTAGEALRADLHTEWVGATGRPLYEALGQTEISTYLSSGPLTPTRPGSPGRPQPGRTVAILPLDGGAEPVATGESGLIAIDRTDPGLMLRYWNDPEATARVQRGRWFVTGDVGRFDEDSYLWYEGRADDQMNAFGYRVAPEEVEAALASHPDIAELAVAETRSGDVSVITAFVVPRDGVTLDPAALDRHARMRLADYKCPRRYVALDALPRTATGKALRRALTQK